MKVHVHGAAQCVTGSCFRVELPNGRQILIDCGLYQGGRETEELNYGDFGFDASSIDCVLLTHAHLDHCGRLPLLVARGFQGKIIATSATLALARLVLLDAAFLQEEEAKRSERRAERNRTPAKPALYTTIDAMDAIACFDGSVQYGQAIEIAPGVRAVFYDAGHILGSASIRLECDHPKPHSVTFSGDVGKPGRPILRDPQIPPHSDLVLMESTYGDRQHRPYSESRKELIAAIKDTLQAGGNTFIPSFALERTQELLYILREAVMSHALPWHLPVFVDSPLAISATRVFRQHPQFYDRDALDILSNGHDPFALPGLRFTRTPEESMALNRIRSGAVIIAGSGMCTGGRIRHHLRHNLWRENCSVIFTSYAAPGTPARRIIDGAPQIRLFGDEVAVRARIYTINGFSAHADRHELQAWLAPQNPTQVALVHGDSGPQDALKQALSARMKVLRPNLGDILSVMP